MRKLAWAGWVWMTMQSVMIAGYVQAADSARRAFRSNRVRYQRDQLHLIKSLTDLRRRVELHAQTSAVGYDYVSIIPYVTVENNTRTNIGLNNYSTDSFLNGQNPDANVLVALIDPQGSVLGTGEYVVGSNEMRQIDNVIAALGGTAQTGWLLIFSDEPLTAWASVIATGAFDDPSIELAIADQIFKPAAFVESTGPRLVIQSSVKSSRFQSSLVVVNVGGGSGNLRIKIYDNGGQLISTRNVSIPANGMFVDDDIRASVSGTFGQIVMEVDDADPGDDGVPRLVANSIVRSRTNGTGAFFPAFALPQANTRSIGGIWEGTLTGGLINAQVEVLLYQERDMLYGNLVVLSGSFPTTQRDFLISGEVIDNNYLIQIQEAFDSDSSLTFFSLRLFGSITGTTMEGDTIYFDEQDRRDAGSFSFSRTGAVFE